MQILSQQSLSPQRFIQHLLSINSSTYYLTNIENLNSKITAILDALNRQEVDYALNGGFAIVLHGSPGFSAKYIQDI